MSVSDASLRATRDLTDGLKKMEIAVSNMDLLPETAINVFAAGMYSSCRLGLGIIQPLYD